MEYLVTMTTHVPEGTPDAAVDDIRAREAARSRETAYDCDQDEQNRIDACRYGRAKSGSPWALRRIRFPPLYHAIPLHARSLHPNARNSGTKYTRDRA